jgi:proline iminopeptidase
MNAFDHPDPNRRVLIAGYDSPQIALEWFTRAMPFYNPKARPDADAAGRAVISLKVLMSFLGPNGEGFHFDMLADLARVRCPTLVLGGDADPITPIEAQEDIARALPQHLVRFERFPGCGHGVFRDEQRGYDVIRDFISS